MRTALFRVITRPSSENFLPTFRDNMTLEYRIDRFSRNVSMKLPLLGRLMTQKIAVLDTINVAVWSVITQRSLVGDTTILKEHTGLLLRV